MSSRPGRDTTAGRVYLELQARARREGRPTDELLVLYVLERFLFRLARSAHRSNLILKGGMLLAALEERRPTRDVDLLAQAVDNDIDAVGELVRDVIAVPVDDGVEYDTAGMRAETTRDLDPYPGVRIVVPASVQRARLPLRIDVNIGDPVTPAPIEVAYPTLLGEPFVLMGYPIETVLAEKIVTMIDRGDATTRERDFADVVILTRRHAIDARGLRAAIEATAEHRGSTLRPVEEILVTLADDRQADWKRYTDRAGLATSVPVSFADAIAAVCAFADPILTGAVLDGSWSPDAGRWRGP